MEEYMIDLEGDELTHWGIKGQKWGERKYQYKDGSLTPAGRKRYGDAPDFVKKNKVSRKVQKQRAKNLEKARQAKAEKKKAEEEAKRKEEEALKNKERLLKSVDAKELYKNKDLLTDAELNARINRIDLENKLNSRIEPTKTGMEKATEYLDKTTKLVTAGSNLYKSVDGVVSMVTGKNIGKHLGLDTEKVKAFNEDDFMKKLSKGTLSTQEIKDGLTAMRNQKEAYGLKSKLDEAKDSYSNYSNSKKPTSKIKEAINKAKDKPNEAKTDKTQHRWSGDVVGTSTDSNTRWTYGSGKTKKQKSDIETVASFDGYDVVIDRAGRTNMSDVSSDAMNKGRSAVTGYLENSRSNTLLLPGPSEDDRDR